ncbi:MAG TPA: sialidase family protein [Chloroflexota bacterium]|nr:sialidase family protein [Chloroflexota bacterium]
MRFQTSAVARGCLSLVVVASVLLALSSFLALPAEARTGAWSQPILLSTGQPLSWFPAITTDIYGNVHVVWNSSDQKILVAPKPGESKRLTEDASWLYYTEWNGQRWSAPTNIEAAVPATIAVRSALVADHSGQLDLIYRGLNMAAPNVGQAEDLRFSTVNATRAGAAINWSSGLSLNRRTPAYFPTLAVDSRGWLHTVWTEYDGVSGFQVYYSRSSDGGKTWSLPTSLEDVRSAYYFRLQLKVGPRDDLHVVWEVVDPAKALDWAPPILGFVYAQSLDHGTTWSKTSFVPSETTEQPLGSDPSTTEKPSYMPQQPAIGIDGTGQVLLIWKNSASNVIYFQRSADGSHWSAPEPVPGIAAGIARPFDQYDTATDSAGHVHLVTVGYRTGSKTLSLLHSEWDESRWSAPDVVANAPPYPEWPRIAIANGNRLHVVWFDGDSIEISRTPIDIRYSTAESSAPFVNPARPPPAPRATAVVSSLSPPVDAIPDDGRSRALTALQSSGTPASAAGSNPTRDNAIIVLALSLGVSCLLVAVAYGLRRSRLIR